MPIDEQEIFENAFAIEDEAERKAFLSEACHDNLQAIRAVEALLDSAREAGSFMAKQAADSFEPTSNHEDRGEVLRSIGPYKLLELIGEGGFGHVYMAEQTEPIHRRVALKIIKPGMDSKQVVARFEAERQALALMDHPNIGKILDAGATEAGRPYFVMELVRGIPITDYCVQRKLSAHERLELFKEVCGAIEHAHQKGIIHRDIKPSNILVYNNGERAVPKVIDFGIAKATQGRLTDKTLFTQFHQFIGTPAYMSPEQAQMSGVDVDTRSDIYSLGVLLYELLTGKTPLDLKILNVQAYQEACRLIREDEAPVPSKRVSTLTQDELTSLADSQRTTPTEISSRLRGDLDWIVMKALEKDRTRRYRSTDALVTDIARHLNNEPVSAGPPSALYYARKFFQRHRTVATTAFAFATLLVVGTVVSVVGWGRAVNTKRELANQVESTQQALSESNRLRTEVQQANEELARRIYLAQLANADRSLMSENYLRARVELDSCSESLRSWEWHFLSDRLSANAPAILQDAGSPIFTADGKHLITSVYSTAAVRIWDTASLEQERTLSCEYELSRLTVSPDGRLLAGGDEFGNQIVLDLDTGKKIWSRKEYNQRFRGPEFSPDGRFLASFWEKHGFVFADALTGEKQFTIRIDQGIWGFRFSTDGRWIFASGWTSKAPPFIVDVEKREVAKHFPPGQTVLGLHPNGEHIAAGSREGIITIWRWDGREFSEVRKLEMSKSPIASLCFSSDGKRLVASDRKVAWIDDKGNSVKVWDTDTGHELAAMDARDTAWSVRFAPGQREQVAVSTISGGVVLWRYEARKEGLTLKPVEARAVARFSPDGRTVVASHLPSSNTGVGAVAILDAASGESTGAKSIKGQWHLASWIDQRRIVCGVNSEHELRVYDTINGKQEATFKCPTTSPMVHAVAAENRLVAAFDDGTFGTWDLNATSDLGASFGNSDREFSLYGVAMSHDNSLVAIAFWGEYDVEVWDVATQELVQSLPVPGQIVNSIVFTKGKKSMYFGSSGGRLTKVDIATGETTKQFVDHKVDVVAVALSPDEGHIVSGDSEGKVIIWGVEHEQPLVTLSSNSEPVLSLDWSADCQRIVAGKEDGTIQIWSLPSSSF